MSEGDRGERRPSNKLTIEGKAQRKPHEQLVTEFKDYISQRQLSEKTRSPAEIIHARLESEVHSVHLPPTATQQEHEQAAKFFHEIRLAWDAVAYDRYEIGSFAERYGGSTVWLH